jgi:ribosome maturation factor RimP
VQDCVNVTHQVGALLDVHDPISGEYSLEVSSPGWDRPFFSLAQMQDYIGQQVALRLITAVDNRRKFQAKLVAVDIEAETIQVEVEKAQVLDIDLHNIDKANLVFQD